MTTQPAMVTNMLPMGQAVNGTSRKGLGCEDLTWRVALPEEEETRKGRYSYPKKPNRGEREGGCDAPARLIQAEQVYVERIGGMGGGQSAENFRRNRPL